MGSLLEYVNTAMKPAADKAKLSDLLLVQREIPEADISSMAAVPQCMFDNADPPNMIPRNIVILAWIQMKREKPDIEQEEVMDIISFHDRAAFVGFMEQIYWFWADLSREEFDIIFEGIRESIKTTPLDGAETEQAEDINPTLSESS